MKKSTKFLLASLVSILFLLLLTGCSSGKNSATSIVGNWAEKGSTNVSVRFYEDGEFDGPYSLSASQVSASKYSVMSDGTLKLQSFFGETLMTFEKVNSKEPNSREYYLKGDTLIIDGTEYVKVK